MRELSDCGEAWEEKQLRALPRGAGVWVDLTALVYARSYKLMRTLSRMKKKGEIELWVEEEYCQKWKLLEGKQCGEVLPEKRRVYGEKAFVVLCQSDPQSEKERVVWKQIQVIVTGNQTEAMRRILGGETRDLILLSEKGVSFLRGSKNRQIQDSMEELTESCGGHIAWREPQPMNYDYLREVAYRPFLGRKSRNSLLYETEGGRALIKLTTEKRKLEWMIAHPVEFDTFAWPQRVVYHKERSSGPAGYNLSLIGYRMKKWTPLMRVREVLIHEVDEAVRLELCIALIKKALYLHMRGILVTNYSLDHFGVDGHGRLIMLDCIGYSIHDCAGKSHTPDYLSTSAGDYASRSGLIQAEYKDLCAVVFYILSKGIPLHSAEQSKEWKEVGEDLKSLETPWQLLNYISGRYEKRIFEKDQIPKLSEVSQTAFCHNPNLKRRPVVILVENSKFCGNYIEKVNHCFCEILKKLCREDQVTAQLTDIQVLSFADLVRGSRRVDLVDCFRCALDLSEEIGEIRFCQDCNEECKLGESLDYAVNSLERYRKEYSTPGKFVTCIVLGSFRTYPRSEHAEETEKKIELVNKKQEDEHWNMIYVRFEKEESLFLRMLKGEKYYYRNNDDAKKITGLIY